MQNFWERNKGCSCAGVDIIALYSRESKQAHFTMRLWDSRDLVKAIYRHYDRLPAEIQADLPLQKVWMLVAEDSEA